MRLRDVVAGPWHRPDNSCSSLFCVESAERIYCPFLKRPVRDVRGESEIAELPG